MRTKFLYILFVLVVFKTSALAQQVTVRLEQRPVSELFDAIEAQTEYSIFCPPELSDSLIITINVTNAEPLAILRVALQNTDYQLSVFQNYLFIIKDITLITALPESFYTRSPTVASEQVLPVFERESRAASETLVYTIGNPDTPSATDVLVTGVVTNFATGETMPGITLLMEDPLVGTSTDAFCFYSIRLPAGRRELIIRGVGIRESRRQMMLYSDGRFDIELNEQTYSISELTVLATRLDNIRSVSGGIERLQMRNIRNIPTVMGEADILRIVMTLPGVTSVGEVSTGFNVRGGATDQNLVLFNDATIFAPTHMFGLFSAFNPDIVDNVELYKSGIPAKYGGRISSVLDIKSRDGNRRNFAGSASLGLLTSRLTLEGPVFAGSGSYIVAARATYLDRILRRFWPALLEQIPDVGFRNGTAGFHDMFGSVNYRINDNNIIFLNAYYSQDRFSFVATEQYSYRNANFSARWRRVSDQGFISSFVVGHDHYSYSNRDTTDIFNAYSLDFSINQSYAKADFTYHFNNEHSFSVGVNGILYHLEPGNLSSAHSASLISATRLQTERALETAAYTSHEWEITPELMVSVGLRYSMFNVLGRRSYNIYSPGSIPSPETILSVETMGRGVVKTWHAPEFRLSARYIINENTSVKAGVNTMQQYIHKISNTTIMSPTDIWKLSDVNIRPTTGTQYVIGLYRNFSNNTIETSIETYYKSMKNYLDYRGGAQLFMNPDIETEVAGVRGRAYGTELMLRRSRGRINGWVSYTWARTMLRRHEELASAVNSREWYPADFDKPHEMKLVGNFKITQRYSFSLNVDHSTGRPITLPVSKYWFRGRQYVYYSERNKYRIPDFFRMDLSFNIEYGHRITKLTHSYLTFGVYNLTGRKNAYSVYFVEEEGQIKGYKLSVFGVQVPYVSYNIKF